MKVLFVGTMPITGGGVAPDSMEAHIVAAFESTGVECRYFPFLAAGFGQLINKQIIERLRTDFGWLRRTPVDRLLASTVRAFEPDLVLTLLGNYVPVDSIRLLRELTDAPMVCWCQDHMGQLGRQYLIGARYDHVFAKDTTMLDLFRRYTRVRAVHYLPEACNPQAHRPVQLTATEQQRYFCDVATAATLYYFRSDVLEGLRDTEKDLDLRIWGSLPKHYRGPLRDCHQGTGIYLRDKAACFSGAKIVINTLHPMESGGLNARAFEVAGCGGFQLISHNDAVARHFEPGVEIETFYDVQELRDKVRYYLAHDDERRAIAEAGRKRAHADHTYKKRLEELLATVFPAEVRTERRA